MISVAISIILFGICMALAFNPIRKRFNNWGNDLIRKMTKK